MAARFLGDKFGFRSGILSTVQRPDRVDRAVGCAIRFVLEERADVWQLAARPAINALPFAPFGDRQHTRHRPSNPGTPGICSFISHTQEHTPTTPKVQAQFQRCLKTAKVSYKFQIYARFSFNIRIGIPNIQCIPFQGSKFPPRPCEDFRRCWPIDETISVCPIHEVDEFLV